MRALPCGSRAQDERDRTVVDDRDAHRRTKAPRPDRQRVLGPKDIANEFVEGFGRSGRRGVRETRPVAGARVTRQRELADQQNAASDVDDRAVHFPARTGTGTGTGTEGLVWENAQLRKPCRHQTRVRRFVITLDSKQYTEPTSGRSDHLAIDGDRRLLNALNDGNHAVGVGAVRRPVPSSNW